jgi:hypothetical protein
MSATDPIDAARLGLLLGDLRLPAVKHIWPRFAERADKEGWPAARFPPPWPSTRSPSAPGAASSATSPKPACRPARPLAFTTWSRLVPASPSTAARLSKTCSVGASIPAAISPETVSGSWPEVKIQSSTWIAWA